MTEIKTARWYLETGPFDTPVFFRNEGVEMVYADGTRSLLPTWTTEQTQAQSWKTWQMAYAYMQEWELDLSTVRIVLRDYPQ